MTRQDREELVRLEGKEKLDDREFVRYEYLQRQMELAEVEQVFRENQAAPYEEKVSRAANLAWEFYNKMQGRCYVAVGGLDSLTLLCFLRREGIHVPAVSVSSLEDTSIQAIHRELGVEALKPEKSKVEVLREHGWPVLSKEIAGKIDTLQHPTEKNRTVRHAIMTGETGRQGGYRTGSRMQLAKKWLELFGGLANEEEGTHYQTAPFQVSDKCCYYLKETPCNRYAKQTGRYPYMGLMASEGGRREKALIRNGCNYISPTTARSCPFATFQRDDLLQLALDLQVPVPEIYGEIVRDKDGRLRTTKAQRTGCTMCGFGIQLEKRPHRFDRLREQAPKEWEFWMSHVMQDENGLWYGWGRILDYIGVAWRDRPDGNLEGQLDWMNGAHDEAE